VPEAEATVSVNDLLEVLALGLFSEESFELPTVSIFARWNWDRRKP